MINILYHHRTQGRGGEGRHIQAMVKAFEQLDCHVEILSPPGVVVDTEIKAITKKKSAIGTFMSMLSQNAPQVLFEIAEVLYNISAWWRIRNLLETKDFTFVYERYAFFSIAGSFLCSNQKIKLCLEVNEVVGIERQRNQILVALSKYCERKIFEKAHKLFVVSSFIKQECIKRGVPENKIIVLPNAIDEEQSNFNQKNPNQNNQELPCIGFIGHFSNWDRLDWFIDVLKELRTNKWPFSLVLVGGGGPEQILLDKVKNENLDWITITGKIPRKTVQEYLDKMDICVLPHSNDFGSPLVLFEFMAAAKGIVAPDILPISDVITHEHNGLLFKLGDSDGLRACIIRFLDDTELLKKLSKNAKIQVYEKHTWTQNARKVLECLH